MCQKSKAVKSIKRIPDTQYYNIGYHFLPRHVNFGAMKVPTAEYNESRLNGPAPVREGSVTVKSSERVVSAAVILIEPRTCVKCGKDNAFERTPRCGSEVASKIGGSALPQHSYFPSVLLQSVTLPVFPHPVLLCTQPDSHLLPSQVP